MTRRYDLSHIAVWALSVVILTAAIVNIFLHVFPGVLPLAFGFDGWRIIAGQKPSSWTVSIILASVSTVFLISIVRNRAENWRLSSQFNSFAKYPSLRWILLTLLWLLAVGIFWTFRAPYVMGDGYSFADSLRTLDYFQPRWYLAQWFAFAVDHTLGSLFALSGLESLRLTSVLAGATTGQDSVS